jgi:hypothetical protein
MDAHAGENLTEHEKFQRKLTDYFDYWRDGIANKWDGTRAPEYLRMQFPRPGAMPDWPLDHRPGPIGNVDLEWKDMSLASGVEETKEAAEKANMELRSRMVFAGFKFVKLLGWGGCGVAALYQYDPLPGTVGASVGVLKPKVVVKMDIGEDGDPPTIPTEIKNHEVGVLFVGFSGVC